MILHVIQDKNIGGEAMNRIEEMIKEMCPDGVRRVRLGEIGSFENIGTDKKIIEGEQFVTLLNYVDVYHNKKIDATIPTMQVTASDKKRESCTVEQGDIFVTPTSETIDDIGHTSVITETIQNAVYSYHIMRFRQKKLNMTTSYYINYYFDSYDVKSQIMKKAQGLTRFGLSKDKFASIEIPLPPLPIQQEIVKILDSFTALQQNLEDELKLRQKQYEHYREKLLTFEEGEVEWKKLGKICTFIRGPFGGSLKKDIFVPSGYAVYEQQHAIYGKFDFRYFITEEKYLEMQRFKVSPGDIIMSCSGTMGKTAIIPNGCKEGIINQALLKLTPSKEVNNIYLVNLFSSEYFKRCIAYNSAGGAISNVASVSVLKEIVIPVPSLEKQSQITQTLDHFESLISNLKTEIELRKKQYEYYREKLLTF